MQNSKSSNEIKKNYEIEKYVIEIVFSLFDNKKATEFSTLNKHCLIVLNILNRDIAYLCSILYTIFLLFF